MSRTRASLAAPIPSSLSEPIESAPAGIDRLTMGERLRALRKGAGLTLRELSARSGVTLPTLSKMELGRVSISYEKFAAVARALDVDIARLFDPQAAAPVAVPTFVRSSPAGAPLYTSDHYAHHMLAVDYPGKWMTPVHGRILARSLGDFPEFMRHPGQEFVTVLTGAVRICFETGEHVDLKPTESAYFDSGVGHVYVSTSRRHAEVLIVMARR
ncbi:helix-turn-helix transcriptional regulator [Achromobacter sp. GG226]|uniref:helix-turn-helix domain-containing protein n=1 Tax=Verticiella alkaliphila TaxID=2779529 RepID=UPI00209AB5CC|nr:XRE family transcriptional regulator [Verticiella sp. GG226]MBU4609265.1 helix-turn-helix transcriptional regulator [Verticiella sp. GG226]